jgi:hypothetical protein
MASQLFVFPLGPKNQILVQFRVSPDKAPSDNIARNSPRTTTARLGGQWSWRKFFI